MRQAFSFTRAITTLAGALAAAALIWAATELFPAADEQALSAGDYWGIMGLLAAAGLAVALSQLLGGWTKSGSPLFSPTVFLLGFLPVLVVAGFVVWANQPPEGGWLVDDTRGFAEDIGARELLNDLSAFLALYPFAIGLLFGVCFDTAAPEEPGVERRRRVEGRAPAEREQAPSRAGPADAGREAEAERPTTASEAPTHPLTPSRDDERPD
jgi:MFS family permease